MVCILANNINNLPVQCQNDVHTKGSSRLPQFDLTTCDNMCRTSEDCAANGFCLPLQALGASNCGICMCGMGYTAVKNADGTSSCVQRAEAAEHSTDVNYTL